MTKIKKIFSPNVAKTVIKVFMIILIAALLFGLAVKVHINQKAYLDPEGEYQPLVYVVFISVIFPLGEWENLIYFNTLYKLPYEISEILELVLFIIYAAAIVMKLIDYRLILRDSKPQTPFLKKFYYIFSSNDYSDDRYHSNKTPSDKTAMKRVFNVLGIIALPIWTAYMGMSLWFVARIISFYAFHHVNATLYRIITAGSYTLIFAIPTIGIFIYSLILDIAGLRSKTVEPKKG